MLHVFIFQGNYTEAPPYQSYYIQNSSGASSGSPGYYSQRDHTSGLMNAQQPPPTYPPQYFEQQQQQQRHQQQLVAPACSTWLEPPRDTQIVPPYSLHHQQIFDQRMNVNETNTWPQHQTQYYPQGVAQQPLPSATSAAVHNNP